MLRKESLSGAYRLSAYYLAQLSSEFAMVLIFPSLHWLLIYFSVGFTLQASNFLLVLLTAYMTCFEALVSDQTREMNS